MQSHLRWFAGSKLPLLSLSFVMPTASQICAQFNKRDTAISSPPGDKVLLAFGCDFPENISRTGGSRFLLPNEPTPIRSTTE